MRTITIHDRNDNNSVDATIKFDGKGVKITTEYPILEQELLDLLKAERNPNKFMDKVLERYEFGTVVYAQEGGKNEKIHDRPAPQPPASR